MTYSMVTSLCINETFKDTRISLGICRRVYRKLWAPKHRNSSLGYKIVYYFHEICTSPLVF